VLRWKVRTHGVACHSSTPQLGVNAIFGMARVLEALERHAGELARSTADPILGPPSLSVGRIDGGQSVNVVPDWCEIEVDRRLIPGEDPAASLRAAREMVERHAGAEIQFEFAPPWVHMPPLSALSARWIEPLAGAIESATGRRPLVKGVPFGTDAGPLSESGTPCVVFGPGDIAQAHTKDEWIDLDEVRLAAEAYFRIAALLG
jgi:acetylornithine deacetylase/succinyl-diaminopimelate desuccinylase-like protein